MNNPRLTAKQARFVDEYLTSLNATQAAIRAGYSRRSARQVGEENLSKPDIQAAIGKGMKDRSQRVQIDQDRVLREIGSIAFSDPRQLFNADGTLKPVQDWPDNVAAAVSAVKVREVIEDDGTRSIIREVKFWDKTRSLEMAGRHLGMFNDKLTLAMNPATALAELEAAARVVRQARRVRQDG